MWAKCCGQRTEERENTLELMEELTRIKTLHHLMQSYAIINYTLFILSLFFSTVLHWFLWPGLGVHKVSSISLYWQGRNLDGEVERGAQGPEHSCTASCMPALLHHGRVLVHSGFACLGEDGTNLSVAWVLVEYGPARVSWTCSSWSLAKDEGSPHLLHRWEGTGVLGSPSQLSSGITRWLNLLRNHVFEPLVCRISQNHK